MRGEVARGAAEFLERTGHKPVLAVADPVVDGILVQLPLPRQIDPDAVIEAIDPARDADGFHPLNLGRLMAGHTGVPLAGARAGVQ